MEKFKEVSIQPEQKKEGWQNAPENYKTKITQFLKNHFSLPVKEREKIYDQTQLEFSEANETLQTIKIGGIDPEYIKILYENNEPKRIHAYFKPVDNARGNDVYLKGKTLEDFLAYME